MSKKIAAPAAAKRFDEIHFYDDVYGSLTAALGIVECAHDAAQAAEQRALVAALGVVGEKLDIIREAMKEWDMDRAARAKAAQERCAAARVACGVGDPAPLNAATRRRLRRLLADSDPKRRKTTRRRAA